MVPSLCTPFPILLLHRIYTINNPSQIAPHQGGGEVLAIYVVGGGIFFNASISQEKNRTLDLSLNLTLVLLVEDFGKA